MCSPEIKKTAVNVNVTLTQTQLKHIRAVTGLRGGTNENAVKILVNGIANKTLRIWK